MMTTNTASLLQRMAELKKMREHIEQLKREDARYLQEAEQMTASQTRSEAYKDFLTSLRESRG